MLKPIHSPRLAFRGRQTAMSSALLFALLVAGIAGCKTPSALTKRIGAEEHSVAVKDEKRWTDFLRPRPRVDSVDAPTWEVPDKDVDVSAIQVAYGNWMSTSGNAKAAEAAYESALEEDPEAIDALIGLARIDLTEGRADEAKSKFEKALRIEPRNAMVLAAYGQFELDRGRVDAAAEKLTQAIEIDPKSSHARFQLAVARARQGRIPEARALFVATVGEAEAHHNLGMILKDSRPLEAAAEFRSALAKKPTLQASAVQLASLDRVLSGPASTGPTILPAGHESRN